MARVIKYIDLIFNKMARTRGGHIGGRGCGHGRGRVKDMMFKMIELS